MDRTSLGDRMKGYEADICRHADRVVAVSQADKDAILAVVPSDRSPHHDRGVHHTQRWYIRGEDEACRMRAQLQ